MPAFLSIIWGIDASSVAITGTPYERASRIESGKASFLYRVGKTKRCDFSNKVCFSKPEINP